MSKLSETDFIKMANKIYIQPKEEVVEALKKEYESINNALQTLDKINVSNIEPMTRISQPIIYLRKDEPNDSIILNKEIALANAKEKNEDYIIIKRILK